MSDYRTDAQRAADEATPQILDKVEKMLEPIVSRVQHEASRLDETIRAVNKGVDRVYMLRRELQAQINAITSATVNEARFNAAVAEAEKNRAEIYARLAAIEAGSFPQAAEAPISIDTAPAVQEIDRSIPAGAVWNRDMQDKPITKAMADNAWRTSHPPTTMDEAELESLMAGFSLKPGSITPAVQHGVSMPALISIERINGDGGYVITDQVTEGVLAACSTMSDVIQWLEAHGR